MLSGLKVIQKNIRHLWRQRAVAKHRPCASAYWQAKLRLCFLVNISVIRWNILDFKNLRNNFLVYFTFLWSINSTRHINIEHRITNSRPRWRNLTRGSPVNEVTYHIEIWISSIFEDWVNNWLTKTVILDRTCGGEKTRYFRGPWCDRFSQTHGVKGSLVKDGGSGNVTWMMPVPANIVSAHFIDTSLLFQIEEMQRFIIYLGS